MDLPLLTSCELLLPLNGDLKNQIRNFEKQKKQILSAKYVCMCVLSTNLILNGCGFIDFSLLSYLLFHGNMYVNYFI